MTIHIFTGEGNYSKSFLDFFAANFDVSNTLIVFRSRAGNTYTYDEKLRGRIIYIENYKKFLLVLAKKLISAEKIIMHYYPIGPSLFFWYPFSFLFSKTTWMMWGGDVYYFRDRRRSFISGIYEFIRRRTIRKFARIACFIKGDYEIIRQVYGSRAEYHYACYPIPVDFGYLEGIINSRKSITQKTKGKTILLGNSASPTNGHLEILDKLAPLADTDIKIICPVSYPPENEYVEMLEARGKQLFSGKFVLLKNMLTPEEYGKLLEDVDLAFMNHRRQQGLGNVLSLLYLGKKVYLRKEVTSFSFFDSIGIKLFDITQTDFGNAEELFYFDKKTAEENYDIIKRKFSTESYISMWKDIV